MTIQEELGVWSDSRVWGFEALGSGGIDDCDNRKSNGNCDNGKSDGNSND
jgi:hypothetical protein